MQAKELITKTQAMALCGKKNKVSFDNYAKLKGFIPHPAITRGRKKKDQVIGTMYDKADVIAKHNMTTDEFNQTCLMK